MFIFLVSADVHEEPEVAHTSLNCESSRCIISHHDNLLEVQRCTSYIPSVRVHRTPTPYTLLISGIRSRPCRVSYLLEVIPFTTVVTNVNLHALTLHVFVGGIEKGVRLLGPGARVAGCRWPVVHLHSIDIDCFTALHENEGLIMKMNTHLSSPKP